MLQVAVTGGIPAPRAPLVGRERDLEALETLLRAPGVDLVCLTGPGGTGKTRLAVEVAARVAAHFADGVRAVNLADLASADLVLPTIARALGVAESGIGPLDDRLAGALEGRSLLLFLDNFEHVVAAAPALDAILARCSGVRCLVTSRAPLHLECERDFPVAPLEVPADTGSHTPEELGRYSAVRLFCERAERVAPGFALTGENANAIARLCIGLDGLPLALELAAARMQVLTPLAFVARMAHRLPLLSGGARDLPARQRSLGSTIEWSYGLLSPAEQGALLRLAVFAGGFSLEAAEFALDPGDGLAGAPSALDLLQALVEAGLVRRYEADGEARFGLFETVREYALGLLEAGSEGQRARDAHADYYLSVACRASAQLDGPEQGRWLDLLELEHPNLRAALTDAMETSPRRALEIAVALGRFWEVRGYISEGRRWLKEALGQGYADSDGLRAAALAAAGTLARTAGDYPSAMSDLAEALRLETAMSDHHAAARTLFEIAQVAHYQGNFERLFEACGESLRLYRQLEDSRGVALASGMHGHAAWHLGDYRTARELLEESLHTWREAGDAISVAWGLWDLGNIAVSEGDLQRARMLYTEAITTTFGLGEMQQFAALLEGFASVAVRERDVTRAARLCGAAESVRTRHGITVPVPYLRDVHRPLVESLGAGLPAEVLEEALAAGHGLTAAAALGEALADGPGPALGVAHPSSEFTRREREVLHLLASGLSNQEIAAALVLSVRTVERHAANVYEKLDVHGPTARAAAAAHAWRHGYLRAAATDQPPGGERNRHTAGANSA